MIATKSRQVNKKVQELLDRGLICKSLIPYDVPTKLKPKKHGGWRLCTNSEATNRIVIKYRFPLLRTNDLMDNLSGAKCFSNINLKSGYHHIQISEGDEWKTMLTMKDGLYEWLEIPFGLINSPRTFMRFMNEVFKPFL